MTSRGKKKQINVIMPPQEVERLKALADSQQRSMSQMAAILISTGLDRAEAEGTQGQQAS